MKPWILLILCAWEMGWAQVPLPPGPLSLGETKAYALRYSPSLERQRLSVSNRVDEVIQARSTFDPVFGMTREWQEEDDPGRTTARIQQTFPADVKATLSARYEEEGGAGFNRYALDLSKTILGGGGWEESRLPVRRSLIQEAREVNTLSLEQRQLMLSVTRGYYAVVRNLLTLELRKLQLDRARTNLEHARIKEDPLDIATAELRIPESELDVLRAQRSIEEGLLDLKETIGMPLPETMTVNTQLVFDVRPLQMEEDLSRALGNHEQILNARLSTELARRERDVARTKNLPEVSVGVTLVDEQDSGDDPEITGQIALEWPWLDREDRAAARQAERSLQQKELEEFEAMQSVGKRVRTVALQVVEAERAVRLQEERLDVLERQFRLYQDRWENGEINILEYVRSQNDLENARVQLITQQTRYLELRAEYDFVTGPE